MYSVLEQSKRVKSNLIVTMTPTLNGKQKELKMANAYPGRQETKYNRLN